MVEGDSRVRHTYTSIIAILQSTNLTLLCLTGYAHFVEGMFVQAQMMNVQYQTMKSQQFDRIVYRDNNSDNGTLSLSYLLLILGIN